MIYRPHQIGAFEFAVLAARRAEQLSRGCTPRVEGGHNSAVTAQLEVIAGKVVRAVEGATQERPGAVEPTQTPTALRNEKHQGHPDVVRTAAQGSAGLVEADDLRARGHVL